MARILFGLSAVLFGIIALMWHDADTWQSLFRLLRLPSGEFIGGALMAAQIIGGIGLMLPRSSRPASALLLVVFGITSLTCVPAIFAHPQTYAAYGSFFEQFSLFCGALAVFTAAPARIGLGLCAVSFALAQAFYLKFTASLVPKWMPPDQMFWAVLTTVAFALAAIALLTSIRARLAARSMVLMIVLFGLLVWVPLLAAQPQSHGNWSEFLLTFLIAGASWTVGEEL
ncbi:MAG TPA: hypothetical protein VFL13_08955 [Candidatus Baltobacteraceae bacterium]|nr:hypothetical protein [Candidatus Baltobacteraceae bacterium]